MIGRIDSTPDFRRGLLRAVVALVVLGGSAASTSTTLAQGTSSTPARKPQVKVKGLEPPAAPTAAMDAPLELGPPPASMPPPIEDPRPPSPPLAPRDSQLRPVELEEANPGLPGATKAPGGVSANPGAMPGSANDPFALPPERMSPGKQKMLLSVEVVASPIINLGKETTVKLVVKNESNVDASAVSLVYQLPEGLKINSSTPPAGPIPGTSLYAWRKEMLAASSEWTVVLKVVATSNKPCEHAATVTAKTGSRANSIVQEPKLKVEATSAPGRVLKGEQVTFQISVRNTGTGPARNITVQAKLSSGLKYRRDDVVEQVIDEIGSGQSFDLESLVVDTVAGGQQTCTVDVQSPDVSLVPDEQRITRNVEVTEPKLVVKLDGQVDRFTGQANEYKLSITNSGTAPAKKVKVAAALPQQGGKLVFLPPNSKFDAATRKLLWSISQLEPLQTVEMTFVYGTSTPGLYRATAEATSGEIRASDTLTTNVCGIAVLDIQVTQTARVMDVGKTNFYDIAIKNSGTKEATRLQLKGKLTGKLKVLKHYNVEKGEFNFNADTGEFLFPEIDQLGVGQTITLSLEVQATESGPAGCKVSLAQADMGADDGPVEDVISTTVTGNNRSKSVAPRP